MSKPLFFFHGGDGRGTNITIVAESVADCIRVHDMYVLEREMKSRFTTHWSKMPFDAERGIPMERGAYTRKGWSGPYKLAKLKPKEKP
jgi:hypothetical protein